jgi:hypothetical protein
MSAVQKWKERAGKEAVKHPSKLEGETPEATRRWKWKAREKLAEHKLEERLQRRADEFSQREKVSRVPVRINIASSRQDALYGAYYEKRRTLRTLGRKQFVRKKAEILVGTGGRLREDPVILASMFHELGHHADASRNVDRYLTVGKFALPSRGKGSRKARWGADVAKEHRATRIASPFLTDLRGVQRWDLRSGIESYRSSGKHKKRRKK